MSPSRTRTIGCSKLKNIDLYAPPRVRQRARIRRIYGIAVDRIVAFEEGKPINVVNAEALSKK